MGRDREMLALRRRMLVAQARLQRLEVADQVGALLDGRRQVVSLFTRLSTFLRLGTSLWAILRSMRARR